MTSDPNKKMTRTFQCREALWQKFEQMARELECSVDYLINDSMKQYARQRGYGATAGGNQSIPPPLVAPASQSSRPSADTTPEPQPLAVPPPVTSYPLPPPPPAVGSRGAPPPPAARPPKRTTGAHAPPPPAPPGVATRKAPPPLAPSRSIPPPPGGSALKPVPPPPMPMPMLAPAAPGQPSGTLSITYQGEVFQVTKDRFIIGRGKQNSDLTIKDPNVSRQHAMIEFLTGQYYIVDMGSTNGVEYNGQRVQRKVISDGDTFKVCDHELRFSFQ
ncbi:MAG: FHA domain-containing protein [Polyangiaceae bacterium]